MHPRSFIMPFFLNRKPVLSKVEASTVRNYFMTLSALASTLGGIVTPICFAVFRLMTNSNSVGLLYRKICRLGAFQNPIHGSGSGFATMPLGCLPLFVASCLGHFLVAVEFHRLPPFARAQDSAASYRNHSARGTD